MFKKITAGILALGLLTTTAISAQVYRYDSGQWSINGYRDASEASCVVSTFWSNGAQININIFPSRDGSQYTTMTIYNPLWEPIDTETNTPFDAEILFKGRFGVIRLTGEFQIYGPQKVIVRNLSKDFSDLFIAARKMIIFPGKAEEMVVGLTGTRNGAYALTECINTVLY